MSSAGIQLISGICADDRKHTSSEILKDQNTIVNHIHQCFHASMPGGAFHEPFEFADLPKLDSRLSKRKAAGIAISTLNSANLAATAATAPPAEDMSEMEAFFSTFGEDAFGDPNEVREHLSAFMRDTAAGGNEVDESDVKPVIVHGGHAGMRRGHGENTKASRPAMTTASVPVIDDDQLSAAVRAFLQDAAPVPVAAKSREEEMELWETIDHQRAIASASARSPTRPELSAPARSPPKPQISVSGSKHLRAFMRDVMPSIPSHDDTPKATRARQASSHRGGTEERQTQPNNYRIRALRLPAPSKLSSSELNTDTCKTYILEWLKNNCSATAKSVQPPAFTINYLQRVVRLRLLIGRVVKRAVDQKLRKTGRTSTENPNIKMARVLKTTVASLWRNGSIVHASQTAQSSMVFPFNGRNSSCVGSAPSSAADMSCSWGGTVAELFSDSTREADEWLPPSSGAASSLMELGMTPAPSQGCTAEDLPDLDASGEAYQLVTPSLLLEEVKPRYTMPDGRCNLHELLRQDPCRLAQRLQRADERWKNLRADSVQELLDGLSEGSISL